MISGKDRKILFRILKKWENGITDSLLIYTNFKKLAGLIVSILNCEERLHYYSEYLYDMEELDDLLRSEIGNKVGDMDKEFILATMQSVLSVMYCNQMISEETFKKWKGDVM